MFLSEVVVHLRPSPGRTDHPREELLLELASSINLQLAMVAAGIRRRLRIPFVIFEVENQFSILFVNFERARGYDTPHSNRH